jgi:hypothetical protein
MQILCAECANEFLERGPAEARTASTFALQSPQLFIETPQVVLY